MQHPDRLRTSHLSPVATPACLVALAAALGLAACGDDGGSGDGGNGGQGTTSATTAGTTTTSVATSVATTTVATTGSTGGDGGGAQGGGGVGGAVDGGGGTGGVGTFVCADGSTCEGSLCSFDPPSETWSCVADDACQEERRCNGECCPTGSRCEAGSCLLPDLRIDVERLADSLEIQLRSFSSNACEIVEGCIDGPGSRRLLRFDLKTPNRGDGDLFLGDPDENEDLFEYSSCHDHFHFTTYASYRLLDEEGNVAATGHKQAFCLLDFEREDGAPNAVYSCGYQGIQSGWADIYDSYLPCQWVDITGLEPGDYQLEITLNSEHVLMESDYTNDSATVPVRVRPNSCPEGCALWDDAVCQPGDPEGHANDGICNCSGIYEWDAVDCASCDACNAVSCYGGCDVTPVECCGDEDTCGRAGDGVCDCGGEAAWDAVDCDGCVSADADCPAVDSCPNGCGFEGNQCQGLDADALEDGWCDCPDQGWDTVDCFSCQTDCGQN